MMTERHRKNDPSKSADLSSLTDQWERDGSDQADPHIRRTCADAALNSTEATQDAALSIGSQPKLRSSETVKGVGPPTQEVCERIPWWTPKEPEKESEQQRTSEEGNPKDARTGRRQPGELPKTGVEWMQHRGEEIWPWGAYERACHASGEAWPNQVQELGTGEEGAGEERRHGHCT
ncbi:hypothetical protein NDU88_002271 [Pleurodeles waltl]|uniref:Uncharacterized protein n=1 Tax=Pleurodeles waltl TaxID=8319 RepID=A0AAV7RF45_PLEWA|nr:hypothetical protein NDU88_002271 [Pleurodeles waltl]